MTWHDAVSRWSSIVGIALAAAAVVACIAYEAMRLDDGALPVALRRAHLRLAMLAMASAATVLTLAVAVVRVKALT